MFSYEMFSFQTSLFGSPVFPRLPNKASLANYLWTCMIDEDLQIEPDVINYNYIIDGGALLRKVPLASRKKLYLYMLTVL